MKNLFLEIAYQGTQYSGSQTQKNSITIQDLLEKTISKMFNQKKINSIFSGRTDAGVHANGQCVNVLVSKKIPVKNVKQGLNSLLPEDIKIIQVKYLASDFHARYAASSRRYLYNIYLGEDLPLYLKGFVWQVRGKLDLARMKKAAKLIVGQKNFATFCAANSGTKNMVRKVMKSEIKLEKMASWLGSTKKTGQLLTYQIEAESFLYHMVRNIVAALVDVGRGKMTIKNFEQAIARESRKELLSITAPPQGLVLEKVNYKKEDRR